MSVPSSSFQSVPPQAKSLRQWIETCLEISPFIRDGSRMKPRSQVKLATESRGRNLIVVFKEEPGKIAWPFTLSTLNK
jgi:hypothetical protein